LIQREWYQPIKFTIIKIHVVILLSFYFSIVGCKKDKESIQTIDKQDLIGTWVNNKLNTDTLFWTDTIILRIDTITQLRKHSYSFELYMDSVKLEYTGEYYILALKSNHRILFNNDKSIITIEGLEDYFPKCQGNQFIKITTKNLSY